MAIKAPKTEPTTLDKALAFLDGMTMARAKAILVLAAAVTLAGAGLAGAAWAYKKVFPDAKDPTTTIIIEKSQKPAKTAEAVKP